MRIALIYTDARKIVIVKKIVQRARERETFGSSSRLTYLTDLSKRGEKGDTHILIIYLNTSNQYLYRSSPLEL